MKRLLVILSGSLLVGAAAQAETAAPLRETSLYKQTARGCRAVDLKSWSHPTRLLLERDRIAIDKVELCNNDRYPIFTVHLRYDPNGPNDRYFNKLFWELFQANGRNAYALVDMDFHVIRSVEGSGKNQITASYDEFASDGG